MRVSRGGVFLQSLILRLGCLQLDFLVFGLLLECVEFILGAGGFLCAVAT
jgi:hypothetical protein